VLVYLSVFTRSHPSATVRAGFGRAALANTPTPDRRTRRQLSPQTPLRADRCDLDDRDY